MSKSSVIIVLFSASDKGETQELTLPLKDAKASDLWKWRTNLEHYNLTFNNSSHRFKPFFYKNETPFKRGFYQTRVDNMVKVGKWYDIEIGKKGTKLWFKLNNEIIFEQEDCKPLKGGHLMFRISGLNREKVVFAKIAIKNLVISHQ